MKFTFETKAKKLVALALSFIMATGLVVFVMHETTEAQVNAANRAVVFASLAATTNSEIAAGRGWYASISPTGDSFIEFDVTVPGYHDFEFRLWGAEGLPDGYQFYYWLKDGAIRKFMPANPTSPALPISIAYITFGDRTITTNRLFAPNAWWYNYIPQGQGSSISFAGLTLPRGRISNTVRNTPNNMRLYQFPMGVGAMNDAGAPLFRRLDAWSAAGPSNFLGVYTRGDLITVRIRVGDIPGGGDNAGDLNDDGVVNASDSTILRRFLAGTLTLSDISRANADLTGTGTVDGADLVRMREFLSATNPDAITMGATGKPNTWPPPPPTPPPLGLATGASAPRMIALTFDDGPNMIYTVQILNILRDAGARATFYVNPNKFNDATIEIVHRMVAEGHEVAHHGWDHTAFSGHSSPGTGTHGTGASNASALADLRMASQHIFDATGYWPWTFRAPFFEWSSALGHDRLFNMAFHGANINTNDYIMQTNPTGIANAVINASPANRDGAIVLFHDCGGSRPGTVEATRLIVNSPALANYHFVTVRELHYYFRNTPGHIAAAGGAPGQVNTGASGIVRNGVGPAATGTALWPNNRPWWNAQGLPSSWWDAWNLPGEQNPWRNPVPPWER